MSNSKNIVFEPIAIDQLFSSSNPHKAGFADECTPQDSSATAKLISLEESELENIKNNSYQEGFNKASEDLKKELYNAKYFSEELSKNLIEKISSTIAELISYEEQRAELMLKVAVKSAEKIAHKLLEENALDIIAKNIKKSLDILVYEPKIVISVHPDMLSNIKSITDEISNISQFKGEIEVISNDNMHQINCNIEWQDGIIEMDHKNLWSSINKVIDN